MTHRLDPLLRPRSIAVIGASERPHSVGRLTVHNLLTGGYEGALYPVNPGRDAVLDLPCHRRLEDLPETVDHVVFCLRDEHLEQALERAIEHGARAVTLMSQLIREGDPDFADRIRARLRSAGLLACGPNGMGFYNPRDGIWVCGFDTRDNHPRGGNVTLISQSGAGMSGIVDSEERIDFNLAVSTGSEFTVGMADYLDFAIEAHAPDAIGLFMETARDPAALVTALDKARRRGIPVLALKVGRTALSARLARSHSGAVAGEDAAYQALFDRTGVQRVGDMDELVAALMLFAQPHAVPAKGGLVALHDSGGERQLLIDLADELSVPLANIAPDTEAELARRLDPGLPAVNPLDGWGAGGPDSDAIMEDCFAALLKDPGAAFGAVVHDRAPNSGIYPEYLDYLRRGHDASGKPAALVSNVQGSGSDPLAVQTTREGFPVIDGLRPFLVGVRAVLAWRDFQAREPLAPPSLDPGQLEAARSRLAGAGALDEHDSLACLAELGLPCAPCRVAEDGESAQAAARALGFPVALKTAMPGQAHKTERRGVHLGLADPDTVLSAYDDLSARLGPRTLVAAMAPAGVEMTLGMVQDDQFGPLVVLGFGGVAVEALRDTVCALPPFDAREARRLVGRLRQRPLLDALRGRPAPDLDAFCETAARFSVAVAGLGDTVGEIDLNPIVVHPGGCLVVDALIIPHRRSP